VIKGKFQKRLLSLKEKESGLFAFLVRGEVIPKKKLKRLLSCEIVGHFLILCCFPSFIDEECQLRQHNFRRARTRFEKSGVIFYIECKHRLISF